MFGGWTYKMKPELDKSSEDVFNRKSFYNVSGYETIQGEYSKYINEKGVQMKFKKPIKF
jgi:hypothetical protein